MTDIVDEMFGPPPKPKIVNTFEELEAAYNEIDKGDTNAYDGSNSPQLRVLTARERDVLCRILTQVIHDPKAKHEEIGRLQLIRHIIDPRRGN